MPKLTYFELESFIYPRVVVLQIYGGKTKPEVLVDGWNVYFFDDLKTLVRMLLEAPCKGIHNLLSFSQITDFIEILGQIQT